MAQFPLTHQLASVDPDDWAQTVKACSQAEEALKNADWPLRNRKDHPGVWSTLAHFLGPQAVKDNDLVEKAQAIIAKLARISIRDVQNYYTQEDLLKAKNSTLVRSENLTIRFAEKDSSPDGSSGRVGAGAFRGFNLITIRPVMFEKFEGKYKEHGRLLHDIEITEDVNPAHLLRNLTKTIIHEAAHCILSAEDVCLEDCNLPKDFDTKYRGCWRDRRTGKYRTYGLDLCRVLTDSPQYLDAFKNADSIAGMVVFLDYIKRHGVWRRP